MTERATDHPPEFKHAADSAGWQRYWPWTWSAIHNSRAWTMKERSPR